eukprot:4452-Pleurochrysis_carterae.AAC.2
MTESKLEGHHHQTYISMRLFDDTHLAGIILDELIFMLLAGSRSSDSTAYYCTAYYCLETLVDSTHRGVGRSTDPLFAISL